MISLQLGENTTTKINNKAVLIVSYLVKTSAIKLRVHSSHFIIIPQPLFCKLFISTNQSIKTDLYSVVCRKRIRGRDGRERRKGSLKKAVVTLVILRRVLLNEYHLYSVLRVHLVKLLVS